MAVLVGLGVLAACTGEDPREPRFDTCGLVDRSTASDAIGADVITSLDESKDLEDAASNPLTCRYLSGKEGPALIVMAREEVGEDAAADSSIAAARKDCADSEELEIEGTWAGFYVHIELSTSRDGPKGAEARPGLDAVMNEVKSNLDEQSFTPR